ncbi:hypothetical protein LXL04_031135 [Taraxacum kok-saghyz]
MHLLVVDLINFKELIRGSKLICVETWILGSLVEDLDAARQRLIDELNKPPNGKQNKNWSCARKVFDEMLFNTNAKLYTITIDDSSEELMNVTRIWRCLHTENNTTQNVDI